MPTKNSRILKWSLGSVSAVLIFLAGIWFAFDGRVRDVESKAAVLESQYETLREDNKEIKSQLREIKSLLMERRSDASRK